jgi:hypothetical protein
VKEEDTAFGAGIVNKPDWRLYDGTNPNFYTLNIEHEAKPGESLSDIQYQATLWLHSYLVSKWGIPIDNDHIIGHYRLDSINRKNDPGSKFPWDKLMSDLRTIFQVNQDVHILIGEKKYAGIMIENVTYMSVRELSEGLGMNIVWDGAGRNIFICPSDSKSQQTTNEVNVFICTKPIKAAIRQDRAYVPVREMAESLGREVIWDNESRIVIIS